MKYAVWTNKEIKMLREAYDGTCPTHEELTRLLPRHPLGSICMTARKLGLKRKRTNRWEKITRSYIIKRIVEMA